MSYCTTRHKSGAPCMSDQGHDGPHFYGAPEPSPSEGVYRVEKRGDGDYSYYVLGPSIKAEWCFDAEADAEDVAFALNAAHQFAFTQGMRRAVALAQAQKVDHATDDTVIIAHNKAIDDAIEAINKEASGGK